MPSSTCIRIGRRRSAQRPAEPQPCAGAVPGCADLEVVGDGADDCEAHTVLPEILRVPLLDRLLVEAGAVVLDDDLQLACLAQRELNGDLPVAVLVGVSAGVGGGLGDCQP